MYYPYHPLKGGSLATESTSYLILQENGGGQGGAGGEGGRIYPILRQTADTIYVLTQTRGDECSSNGGNGGSTNLYPKLKGVW